MRGADKILGIIQADEARGCNTQYMIAGYSQGVISARLAMNLLDNNEDKIISTYVIGDPVNKGNAELSERQVSPAHATSDKDGVLRTGLSVLRQAQASHPVSFLQSFKTKAYLDTLTNSDSMIYKDDTSIKMIF